MKWCVFENIETIAPVLCPQSPSASSLEILGEPISKQLFKAEFEPALPRALQIKSIQNQVFRITPGPVFMVFVLTFYLFNYSVFYKT